jgi:DNA polymerase-3 subunit delta
LKKFSSVAVVDCSKADSALLIKWIKAECGRAEVAISGETAKILSEYCLLDMTRIETETNKLISYVGAGGTITFDDVDFMVARDIEYKIYELTDCIGRKKFDKAFSIIADMTARSEPPQKILVAVYNYFRKLLLAAISGKTSAELAKAFGVKEFAARKTKEQAAMFKKRSLKSAVDLLTDYDYKIKSGQADADNAMWIAVFKIMTDN